MKHGWLYVLILLLCSCGNKGKSEGEEDIMDVNEFIELFPTIKLPFNLTDTSLVRPPKDTTTISYKLVNQFMGDSILSKYFGKSVRPRLYPLGKQTLKKAETYLFLKGVSGTKRVAFVAVLDQDKKFRAALPLMITDNDPMTFQSATMDSRFTISTNKQRKKANGELGYRKEAYVYNNIGVFTLILTESNDDLAITGEVVNPIDTVSRKNKYSADYVKDKRNFISVRDGKKPSLMRFFIHFEKDKGTCKGEVRGEASFVKPNVAVFRESGDPCVLEFTFTGQNVSMKELEGCGNYRDIKCFFEGSYTRKKETKPKAGQKKK